MGFQVVPELRPLFRRAFSDSQLADDRLDAAEIAAEGMSELFAKAKDYRPDEFAGMVAVAKRFRDAGLEPTSQIVWSRTVLALPEDRRDAALTLVSALSRKNKDTVDRLAEITSFVLQSYAPDEVLRSRDLLIDAAAQTNNNPIFALRRYENRLYQAGYLPKPANPFPE